MPALTLILGRVTFPRRSNALEKENDIPDPEESVEDD